MISLKSGFRWNHNYGDILYQEKIRLEDIIPAAGSHYTAHFSYDDPISPGPVRLLWVPPGSEVNGWEETPGEIMVSRVVKGTASLIETKCAEIEVECVIDLPSAMSRAPLDDRFSFPNTCTSGRFGQSILWAQCESVRTATIGPYQYLNAMFSFGESGSLEAILEEVDDYLVLHLHAYRPPGSIQTEIVHYRLQDDEEAIFRQMLATAEVIPVHPSEYLI